MSILNNSVLLLKAHKLEDGDDKYENLLKENGFKVKQARTIDFMYKCLPDLEEKLKSPQDYSGVIFSSPRCVYATFQALDRNSLDKEWQKKKNFVVGEATFREALHKLGLDCKGKETGNAVNLSKFIIEDKCEYTLPFLFPHGNLKTDTLKVELGKENISIEGVLVYDTIPNPNLETELKEATENFTSVPEYIVFFSPSGVDSAIEYLRRLPIILSDIKFIAIGPVTEKALRKENLPVYSTAKFPTPEDVLCAIDRQ